MSERAQKTKSTLLFDAPHEVDFVELTNELKRPFRNIALEFDDVEVDAQNYVVFTSDKMTLRISRGQVPVTRATLLAAKRPDPQDAIGVELPDLMHDYTNSVLVDVTDGTDGASTDRTKLAACYHVVRVLLRSYEASMVLWHHTGMLFTAFEFQNPMEMQSKVKPRRPARGARTQRPVLATSIGKTRFAEGHMQVSENHTRLDESFAQAVVPDGPEAANDADPDGKSWKEIFPNLEPHHEHREESHLRHSRLSIFASDLIEVEEVKFEAPAEPVDVWEQLTVYVMNVTLLVVAFPIGFGLLIYNILSGENIKVNARVMSLTGVATALNFAGIAPQLSAFV